jgi:hypothetical protein
MAGIDPARSILQMNRISYAIIGFLIFAVNLSSFATITASKPEWDFSVKQTWTDGNADFWLHYPVPDHHVISQLHAPQKQPLTVFELKYAPADWKRSYLKFSYGTTGNGNKGRGFDADWTNTSDYAEITDYGTMEFHGKQENFSIDYACKIRESNKSTTNAFIGWTQHKSSNELRDVLYYRVDRVDQHPPGSQDDIGAYYNMNFKGFRLGLEHTCQIGSTLSLTGMASLDFLDTKLKGEWTNHTPTWIFKDSGKTIGYEFGFDAKYSLSKVFSLNLGYIYYYAKSKNCTRMLDSGSGYEILDQPADLELTQHGCYIGIAAQF